MADQSKGLVAVLWNMDKFPVPTDMHLKDVANNLKIALRDHMLDENSITFSVYGDFNCFPHHICGRVKLEHGEEGRCFPQHICEGCQDSGVKLQHVPGGEDDAADLAIHSDLFHFIRPHNQRPVASIMLIAGEDDFVARLFFLRHLKYTVILVAPPGVDISEGLRCACHYVWDWSPLARGEGCVTNGEKTTTVYSETGDLTELKGQLVELLDSDVRLPLTSLPSIYKRRFRRPLCDSGTSELVNLLSKLSDVISIEEGRVVLLKECEEVDLTELKGQLVKLLSNFDGCLRLERLPFHYQEKFGRPLCDSGTSELVNLLSKLSDVISIEEGRFVLLKDNRPKIEWL